MPETPRRGPAAFWGRLAKVYDAEFVQAFIYRPVQDLVIAELRELDPSRIADIGCGTGQLAARIATELRPHEMYGIDLSEEMLQQARARSRDVTWIHAAAEQLPLADGSVDAITSTEAFHWFRQQAALTDFNRVLAPGGHIVIGVLNPFLRTTGLVADTFAAGAGGGHFPRWQEMERLLRETGFRIVRRTRVRRALVGRLPPHYVTVAQRL
jgi:ubiquinone/menaquinone biosynthesis C-methylase UbiE